jgi:hypothetical protein
MTWCHAHERSWSAARCPPQKTRQCPENCVTLCGLRIFVEKSADPVPLQNTHGRLTRSRTPATNVHLLTMKYRPLDRNVRTGNRRFRSAAVPIGGIAPPRAVWRRLSPYASSGTRLGSPRPGSAEYRDKHRVRDYEEETLRWVEKPTASRRVRGSGRYVHRIHGPCGLVSGWRGKHGKNAHCGLSQCGGFRLWCVGLVYRQARNPVLRNPFLRFFRLWEFARAGRGGRGAGMRGSRRRNWGGRPMFRTGMVPGRIFVPRGER